MKQKELIKRYTSNDLTVVWQPSKCSHSKNCFHGLPEVFNPENRPWVQLDVKDNEAIIAQVKLCPSGALSIEDDAELQDKDAITHVNVTNKRWSAFSGGKFINNIA